MIMDLNLLSGQGTYTLLLHVQKQVTVTIGSLGKQRFPVGYYSYTGSAMGKRASLKNRIARHLRKEKRCFWHIDYLLDNENVSVEAVVTAETSQKVECEINQHTKTMMDAKIQAKGFGSSDCQRNCRSHLLFFPDAENVDLLVQNLVTGFRSMSGVLAVHVIR
ncbi:MAG: GIY-YIG nuclease family protein [Candidatus Bathyarchaeota archaeon]|nr:GIY-YIG nuclease family protein [Candidatus Bathyarchaeum sp.]